MRRLIVSEFITLDGVVEEPGGAEGSDHGGWSMRFASDEQDKFKFDELMASDVQLLGRVTYQGFAAVWPKMTDEAGFADKMNSMPKYVVSTTLEEGEWANSTVISGDVADELRKLKEQEGGDILVAGSATLVHTLAEHDLVDEYRLLVHPIVVGGGKRLFAEGTPETELNLTESRELGSGKVLQVYEPVRA